MNVKLINNRKGWWYEHALIGEEFIVSEADNVTKEYEGFYNISKALDSKIKLYKVENNDHFKHYLLREDDVMVIGDNIYVDPVICKLRSIASYFEPNGEFIKTSDGVKDIEKVKAVSLLVNSLLGDAISKKNRDNGHTKKISYAKKKQNERVLPIESLCYDMEIRNGDVFILIQEKSEDDNCNPHDYFIIEDPTFKSYFTRTFNEEHFYETLNEYRSYPLSTNNLIDEYSKFLKTIGLERIGHYDEKEVT